MNTNVTRETQKTQAQSDIINLILEDHKPLKELIKILKDDEKDLNERKSAFEEFAILLTSHAKPEEQTLYVAMKKEEETRVEALEGDVEHGLADQLVEELNRLEGNDDLWAAKAKVLAELVEHHIEEEEEELLPDYKENSEPAERAALGQRFLLLKTKILEQGGTDSPHEAQLAH